LLSPFEKTRSLQKIAIIFFITSGVLHLGSSILLAGNILTNAASLFHKTMDIPFILSGLIYALTSLRLRFTDENSNHKTLDIVGVSVIILALIALLAINIFFADK